VCACVRERERESSRPFAFALAMPFYLRVHSSGRQMPPKLGKGGRLLPPWDKS